MNVSDYFYLKASPSPAIAAVAAPAGRGGNARRALANPSLTTARRLLKFKKSSNGCSLSQRERVRVRESAAAFHRSAEHQLGQSLRSRSNVPSRCSALRSRVSILDCGGKRSATPLSSARQPKNISTGFVRAKAVSPLRSATALQDLADVRLTHYSSLVRL